MRSLPVYILALSASLACAAAPPPDQPSPRANWITLWRQQSKRNWGYNFFLDTLSARKVADSSYVVWIVAEYDTALTDSTGLRYRAEAGHQRLDCAKGTVVPIGVVKFDSTGHLVVARGSDPDSARAASAHFVAPPGSIVYANLKQACAALQHQPFQFDYP